MRPAVTRLHRQAERTPQTIIALIGMILLFTALNLYGSYVLNAVVAEKPSRVIEALLSRVRPADLSCGRPGRVRVMRTVAVVLAGGSGQRFGAGVPKQLLPLAGRALIEHSVAAFEQAPGVDSILVVMVAEHAARVAELVLSGRYRKVTKVIMGGLTRTDSTRQAIAELGGTECDALFHDAARPLVDQQTIAGCVAALRHHRAVGVAVPSSDTIAVVRDGMMAEIPRRDSLVRCQTPQGFRLSVIRRAHELAAADPHFDDLPATDDCGIVLRYLPEVAVHVVPGSERNIKITYPADLAVAETLLRG